MNVRDLDPGHVDALAGLIAQQGVLVRVLIAVAQSQVAGQGFQYELVAGFHRYAAVLKLEHTAIDAVVLERDHHSEGAEVASARAIDNVTRKQLNAYEEPLALQAMAARGLTEDGAAQALGRPKAGVSARIKLPELPPGAQKLIGDGVIPLSCVARLREVGKASPEILAEVLTHIAGGGAWIVGRPQSEIGWVIGRVLRKSGAKAFSASPTHLNASEVRELKLGKNATSNWRRSSRCTRRSTVTLIAGRRSASTSWMSTRPARPGC